MQTYTNFFILLAFLVLVPIVPAYLLYKLLPSTSDVQGTFRGMGIKLTGAFGGYFALVFLLIWQLPQIVAAVSPPIQVWDVQGQVVDETGSGIEPLSPGDIRVEPRALVLGQGGWFQTTVTTQVSKTGQGVKFPELFVGHTGYIDVPVDLSKPSEGAGASMQDVRDEQNHFLKLKTITLKKPATPYNPVGEAPKPADPGAYAAATQTVLPPAGSKQ